VILVSTWQLFRDSLHLMFDGVPSSIDLDAVRAELEALPGVDAVHDLHVWASGTTETVLTAHVVMPAGHPDDAFFRAAADRMRERFGIGHVTLQASTEALMPACGGPMAPPPTAQEPVLHGDGH
jgi:cobalt-zinc-cadmium efflux system protein